MSTLKNGFYIGIPVILMIAIVLIVFFPFKKSENQESNMQLVKVEVGSVIRSFPGEGIVEPQSEVLILSPASSIIKEILKEVGSHVEADEPIIILDPTPIQNDIENIKDQLEMKQNALKKNQLNARSTRVDLDYNLQVRNLKIASLKSELADQEQLLDVGGISPARIEKTRQELELAEKDLVMLKEKNEIKLQQLEADEEGLRLQIDMQQKELEAKEEALKRMIIRAPSSGIILSIRGKVGEKVNSDRLLIEMSDLSTFKVKGSAEDDYSDLIKTGTKVYVDIDNQRLSGVIGSVSPVIRDRRVEFDVNLDESSHWKLRPNLNVNLHIVREERDSVLRMVNGPAIGRGHEQQVYVLENGKPELRDIETGLRTDEYVEIVKGLKEGDRVFNVSPSAIKHPDELQF